MAEIGNDRLSGSSSINGDSDLLHPSCKRAKLNAAVSNGQDEAEEEDRLSALPDCLLLHILSFLDTKEVVTTCLLSKRWQFLWTDLSVLDLREISSDSAKIHSYVDWVGRMLVMCSGSNLSKFFVEFRYQPCFASSVNLWVHYAVRNKVKDITLNFQTSLEKDYYMLPQMLFSCSSLTNINVSCCAMAPRGAIGWGSLKSLSLYGVKLLESVMEKILSGCPVLEVLCLRFCGGFNCLKISSPNVTTLVIEDWKSSDYVSLWGSEHLLEITAPYVRVLSISERKGTQYELKDVSSLVRANLDFTWIKGTPKSVGSYIKTLLKILQSIKELELGPLCTELLSILEMAGYRLLPSALKCLTLNPCRCKDSIPGILGILKYSPNLETLLIKGEKNFFKRHGKKDLSTAYLQNENLDLVAFHVKTIKIAQFVEDLSGEPMLTLVRILLKRATVLEKMVIDADESIIPKLAVTLLSFPRASPKAVVVFG